MLWATRHNTYLELRKWPSDGRYMDGCGGPHGGWWSKHLHMYMWFEIQICRSFLVTHCWGPDNRTPRALLTQTSASSHAFGICAIQYVVILQDASRCCLPAWLCILLLRGDPIHYCVGFGMWWSYFSDAQRSRCAMMRWEAIRRFVFCVPHRAV
jgi:hypothetical protein